MTRQATELWTSWTRDRDERSFESLVRPELPHALGFARRLGCSAADADDALQDALARLAAVRDDSPASVGVRAWLCREVHVRARSRLRSQRRRTARETASAVPPSCAPADSPLAVREEVERALCGLDDDERAAVELRYLHDLDYREMAVVLAASEGACRLRVHKALARLRARLGGNSAALVAAVPLPAVRDVSVLVKGALAKTAVASTATGGAVVMATTAQKVTIAAFAAAALGVAGTIGVQRALAPDAPSTAAASAASTPPEARTVPRGASRSPDPAAAKEIEALTARVASLETDLAAARDKAADFDAMDPMAVLVYSKKPIAWKARKLLEISDEKQRWTAMGKVSAVLAERENTGREILEALKTETDPKVIAMIGSLARGGSFEKTPPDDRRAFVDLLRSAPLPDTRAAAVNALFSSEQFRGGFDEKSKAFAKELNGRLIEALRTETSPDVVGAIAKNFGDWTPPPEAMDLLTAAAERLPASPGRRTVWEAIARGHMFDAGTTLFAQFQAATAQDVKDDIAAGIARAGNSMSGGAGGTAEERAKRIADARARFRIVFGGTSDAAVRKSLLRAALYGLGCVAPGQMNDEQKSDVARFFRETSALEPDAKQREKIEKAAAAFEEKGAAAYPEFDKIIFAKD